MKIYSWNMLFRNCELDRAFDFISKADFDIFCLQEVPGAFLARLQALPFSVAFRTDVEKLYGPDIVPMFNVILSRNPIVAQGEIPFPDYWHLLPLRTKLFVYFMPQQLFSRIRNRGGIYADIQVNSVVVRVFNLHLILAHPAWRMKEFETAMAERNPSLATVVCGDLNTLEKPHITILNWIFGAPTKDAVFYRRERTAIEKRFVEHGLWNPLRGHRTHGLSRSQLDHILVSHHLSVKKSEIIKERFGSDHHPIRAVVSFDTAGT